MAFDNSDVTVDSPINNFAVLNALNNKMSTYSEGNLTAYSDKSYNGATSGLAYATIAIPQTGKWYCEVLWVSGPQSSHMGVWPDLYGGGYGERFRIIARSDGSMWMNGSSGNVGTGSITSWNHGDIISMLCDADAGTLSFYKNGSHTNTTTFTDWNHFDNRSRTFVLLANSGITHVVNFGVDQTFGGRDLGGGAYTDSNGQGQFYYPIAFDNGALALCTKNLPEGQIKLSQDETPSDHFKTLTWIGDTQTSRTHTVGFPADLVWVKNRDHGNSNNLYDSVRGHGSASAGNNLQADQTYPENYYGTYGYVSSVTSTEITFDGGTTNDGYVNKNGDKMVAWFWRAAGSPADNQAKIINEYGTQADTTCAALASAATNAGASNVITPSKVSANRQNGFSIVKWNNQGTVPHGLSKAPEFIIVKSIDQTSGWWVYATALGNSNYGVPLHSSAAQNTSINWGGSPDANVFYVTNGQGALPNPSNSIAYCWHSVAGYSKFGSFTSASDGVYVDLGFKPALIISKLIGTGHWNMYDNARQPFNTGSSNVLYPDLPNEEGSDSTVYNFEFLSNGFRSFGTGSTYNSGTHLFIAFAETPFNAPATAR